LTVKFGKTDFQPVAVNLTLALSLTGEGRKGVTDFGHQIVSEEGKLNGL
jgi:hypothetical protein